MAKLGVFISVILGLFVLASCATLNENECHTVNWQQLGDRDGAQGFALTRIAKHNKACQKHGISSDVPAYEAGWRAGIERYCTPQNGFRTGRSGITYRNSCPSNLADGFLGAYIPARNLYIAERDIATTESRIDTLISEITRLANSSNVEDKARLKEKSSELRYERDNLPGLRADLEIARRDVNDYLKRVSHQ